MPRDDGIRSAIDAVPPYKPRNPEWNDCLPSESAAGRDYPQPEQFVEGFITPGLTILAATPKAGKTTLMHSFAISIASGRNALGILPCQKTEVLCLFLEDNERRMITRERQLAGYKSGVPGLIYADCRSSWNVARLEYCLDTFPARRVIVVDTLERWKQMQEDAPSSGKVYSDEYKVLGELQRLATSRDVAIVLLHHDRKAGNGGNVLDGVSGTRAITGAADHVLLLDRDRDAGASKLSVIGRDLEERTLRFSRDIEGRLHAMASPANDAVQRIDDRVKARKMRADGALISSIASDLGRSKSTISEWCRDA